MTPPSILLGAQVTQAVEQAERGIPRFVREHVRALLGHCTSGVVAIQLDPERPLPVCLSEWADVAPIYHSRVGRSHQTLPHIYHAMASFEDIPLDRMWPRHARDPRIGLVVTLYDVIPLLYPQQYLERPVGRLRYKTRLEFVRSADAVLTISETTRRDAEQQLGIAPHRLHNIGAGCSSHFQPPSTSTIEIVRDLTSALPGIREGFMLCVGGIDPRKNLSGLLSAYARLPKPIRVRHQLVVTCRMPHVAERRLWDLAAALGVTGQILLTGRVSEDVLRALYQSCELFVCPSLYEGFGLPVVEAMECGAPVIVSDTPALAELVWDKESRFDPESPLNMRNTILRALTDRSFKRLLQAHAATRRGCYRWDDVARRTTSVYEDLLARHDTPSPAKSRPQRWACFSPMPPQASRAADYNARLLRALAEMCEVDVFVDGNPQAYDDIGHPRLRLYDARWFPWHRELAAYDRVIYGFGNSGLHAFMWESFWRYGGDTLLYDVRFTRLYRALEDQRNLAGSFDGRRRAMCKEAYADKCVNIASTLGPLQATHLAPLMASEILRHADRVLVPSETARHLALLEVPDAARRVHVVPLALPDPILPVSEEGRCIIGAFGSVSHAKNPFLLIQAFAIATAHLSTAQLVFVGEIAPPLRVDLERLAASLGLTNRVSFLGRLSRKAYTAQLRRTDLAVQLGVHANGEMSGSTGDCLAGGVPTVVSDVGALAELPRNCVVPVSANVTSHALGSLVLALIADDERRRSLSCHAVTYARAHGARVAAKSVWSVLGPLSPAQGVKRSIRRSPRVGADQISTARTSMARDDRVTDPAATLAEQPPPLVHFLQHTAGPSVLVAVDPTSTDPISKACAQGRFPDPLVDLMLALVRPEHRVLDVGAHIGVFSLAAAAHGCEVMAIEASSDNVALLNESVERNRFRNLRVVHGAATDRNGPVGFWALGPWGHVETAAMPSSARVPAVRLDEVLDQSGWPSVDFMKLDVEGSERAAVRGLSRRLSRPEAPIVLYEANAHTLAWFGLTPNDLLSEFEQLGYQNLGIYGRTLVPVRAGDLQPTLLVDYLATKKWPFQSPVGWRITTPQTLTELAGHAANECRHPDEEHRVWIARALARSGATILGDRRVQAALNTLLTDAVEAVRQAASWYAGTRA